MKRFYCKTCQKIRHVRRIPSTVTTPDAYNPYDRIGECAWHHSSVARVIQMPRKVTPKRVTISTPAKSVKRGR